MSNGIVIFGVVVVLVLLCAAFGLNAWIRLRRIDRADDTARPPAPKPAPATAEPADDLPPDPDYQGPGDWDGGPADPPEFRTPS